MKLSVSDMRLNALESHPVRVCGLKCMMNNKVVLSVGVTPRAGVWIEIVSAGRPAGRGGVTPRAGVWIEMPILARHVALCRHTPCGCVD